MSEQCTTVLLQSSGVITFTGHKEHGDGDQRRLAVLADSQLDSGNQTTLRTDKHNNVNWSYLALLSSPLQDLLLDGTLTDQPVHGDLLGLAQSMSPVHGLLVHRWVPVAVVEDDGVSSCQVDAEASCSCTQQENEDVRPKE